MHGVQAWGSVKAHIIIVCERFGHICVTRWGGVEGSDPRETAQSTVVGPIRAAQSREKAAIEIQLGALQIRFNESPDAEQLKVALAAFTDANKPVC